MGSFGGLWPESQLFPYLMWLRRILRASLSVELVFYDVVQVLAVAHIVPFDWFLSVLNKFRAKLNRVGYRHD